MKSTVLLSLHLLLLILGSSAGAQVTSVEAQQPPELLRDHPLQGLPNATAKLPTTSSGSRRRSVESSVDARWVKKNSGRSSSGSGRGGGTGGGTGGDTGGGTGGDTGGGTRGGTGSQSNRKIRSSKSGAQSTQLLRLRSSPSRIALPLLAFFAALLG